MRAALNGSFQIFSIQKRMQTDPSFLGIATTLDTKSVGSVPGVSIYLTTILTSSVLPTSFLGTGTLREVEYKLNILVELNAVFLS